MASWRYRTKDIQVGDIVRYTPSWQPMTEEYMQNRLMATGTVTGTEQLINRMIVTVDWEGWEVPAVVDVNEVVVVIKARTDPA